MIQRRQVLAPGAGTGGGDGDDYIEELQNDHLGLVGASPAIVALRDIIRRVAESARPVLITGPRGAGKSLVADAIHRLHEGDGQQSSLVRVDCGESDERALERILFGTDRQTGVLGAPGVGTLVLEDVSALPEGLQARMVRLLQTGMFRPVGSMVDRRVTTRVLAVTSRSLARSVRENTFRADLLYELGVLTVQVPGLEQHKDDIPALVNHFLRLAGVRLRLSPEALDVLSNRSWPGGVRELRNLIERAALDTHERVIGADAVRVLCIPEAVEGSTEHALASLAGRLLDLPIGNKLAAVEAALLESAMRAAKGNKSAAARLLGLHRKAVERRLEKYDVRVSGAEEAAGAEDDDQLQDPNAAGARLASLPFSVDGG